MFLKSLPIFCLLLASCSKCQMLPAIATVTFTITNANIIADGNSLTYGQPYGPAGGYPALMMATSPFTTNGSTMINKGVSGQTWADMTSDATTDIDANLKDGKTNILICFENTNDIYNNGDATACYNRAVSYCNARRAKGWKVIVCTAPHAEPAANPTPAGDATSAYITKMDAANTLIRNNWNTFADGFVDLAADSRLSSYNSSYYQTDKVHLQTAGYQVVAALVSVQLTTLYP